jgi:hypothetical protein
MDENEHDQKKRLVLSDESGVTRRDLLRRGAIVGGTLLWVAPAIQTMAPKALARTQGPSPGACSACFCWNGTLVGSGPGTITANPSGSLQSRCSGDGAPSDPSNGGTELFSVDACGNWCKHQDIFTTGGAAGGPYQHFQYCSTANFVDCGCTNGVGVTCTGGTIHAS